MAEKYICITVLYIRTTGRDTVKHRTMKQIVTKQEDKSLEAKFYICINLKKLYQQATNNNITSLPLFSEHCRYYSSRLDVNFLQVFNKVKHFGAQSGPILNSHLKLLFNHFALTGFIRSRFSVAQAS